MKLVDFDIDMKTMHPKAKKILKPILQSLMEKEYLEQSDFASMHFLAVNLDTFFKLDDEIGSNYTVQNNKGLTISNPLLKERNVAQKSAMAILADYGGTVKSRRVLNKKEMIEAEDSPFDELNRDELDDF